MKRITVENYRKDKMFSGIHKTVHDILQCGFVVAPIELMLRTGQSTTGAATHPTKL